MKSAVEKNNRTEFFHNLFGGSTIFKVFSGVLMFSEFKVKVNIGVLIGFVVNLG